MADSAWLRRVMREAKECEKIAVEYEYAEWPEDLAPLMDKLVAARRRLRALLRSRDNHKEEE